VTPGTPTPPSSPRVSQAVPSASRGSEVTSWPESAHPFEGSRLEPETALDLLLDTTRSLLWLTTPDQGREAARRFVEAVGGTVAAATSRPDSATIPVDLSFGVGSPVVPCAPPGSDQHRLLARHLPLLVADINRAIAVSRQLERLTQDASLDALTMIPNRQMLGRTLGRLRHGDVVIMLDLDHFKRVNDSVGHAAGDAVLRTFGETLRSMSRSRDVVGRYGGEEFVVILAGGDGDAFLLRLQKRWTDVRPQPVTFSAGIATYTHAASSVTAVTVAADRAMYRAKRSGRDRWLRASGSEYVL
jgi:diguanylate cyclase (GGDEF)-like protein